MNPLTELRRRVLFWQTWAFLGALAFAFQFALNVMLMAREGERQEQTRAMVQLSR